ncbi:eCIS core domain-containing protein [Microcoleus sp. T3_D1]|uniref:eCIS core domain-containing protein n=1 Tax=Microcoleus sp. T3_D1 TaxID=3055427 RepID=UPI002FD0EBDD
MQRNAEEQEEPAQAKLEPVQRQEGEEEDPAQAKLEPVQRQEGEEEEPAQAKLEPVQRQEGEEEDPAQAKLEPVQRQEGEEEEPAQAKLEPVQRQEGEEEDPAQAKLEPVQRQEGEEEDPAQAKLEPVQRQEGEEEDPAQAKGESSQKVKPIQAKINLAPSGGGKLMPEPVQQKMEGAFGADFSGVRIHEGPQAKAINAIAYTQGENIHFQPGKYQPDTQSGQELLGHELTHVVQQRAGRVAAPQKKGIPINADSGLETEADVLGAKAARGEQAQVAGASSQEQGLVKSQLFAAKNDISLKKSTSTNNNLSEQKQNVHKLGDVQQRQKSTVQLKSQDLTSIEDYTTASSWWKVKNKSEKLELKIQEYNKIPNDDKNYKKQEQLLEEILTISGKWLHKYKTEKEKPERLFKKRSAMTRHTLESPLTTQVKVPLFGKDLAFSERIQAIESVKIEALFELDAVRLQLEEDKNAQKEKGNAPQGALDKLIDRGGGGYSIADPITTELTGNSVTTHAMSGAKKVVKGLGFNVAQDATPETVTEKLKATKSMTGKFQNLFASVRGELPGTSVNEVSTAAKSTSLLDDVWSAIQEVLKYLGIATSAAKFALAIVNLKGTSTSRQALDNTIKALEQKQQSDEDDKQLFQDAEYGYKKVNRRYYMSWSDVVTAGISLLSTIVAVFTGPGGLAAKMAIEAGKELIEFIKTVALKVKGFWKFITNKRGKNRRESAERIVRLGMNRHKPSLKLLMEMEPVGFVSKVTKWALKTGSREQSFSWPKTTEEMQKLLELMTNQPEVYGSTTDFIETVAESLKSQT